MNVITSDRLAEMMAASPSRLVVMLYDEAIGALRAAVEAGKANEIERRCNTVVAATEIVGYLHMHLDLEDGGELAHRLGAIYGHILRQLPRVNLYNEVEAAEEAIALLQPLRQSWQQLDLQLAAEAAETACPGPAIAAAPGAARDRLAEAARG